jgi:hypothetical protein
MLLYVDNSQTKSRVFEITDLRTGNRVTSTHRKIGGGRWALAIQPSPRRGGKGVRRGGKGVRRGGKGVRRGGKKK